MANETEPCTSQRVSVYLLGDFDQDDVDDAPTLSPTACSKTPPLNTRRTQGSSRDGPRDRHKTDPGLDTAQTTTIGTIQRSNVTSVVS